MYRSQSNQLRSVGKATQVEEIKIWVLAAEKEHFPRNEGSWNNNLIWKHSFQTSKHYYWHVSAYLSPLGLQSDGFPTLLSAVFEG